MSEELKPCPFCGIDDSLYIRHVEGTILHPAYYVECDNCGSRCGATDTGEHADDWNTRPIEDALRARVAEQQAKIDALMFEHCPEEMTAEQIAEWERHQRVVRDGE